MIGAMPAVAVRHERRKNKSKDKSNRPNRLLLKPYGGNQQDGSAAGGGAGGGSGTMTPMGSHNVCGSRKGSRAGTPTHTNVQNGSGANDGGGGSEFLLVRYGDECFYNKISLLHFIIFFLLGGLTVLIVGGVQFKDEAGLSNLKYHFLIAGGVLIILGIVLLVVKCACFRKPIPNEDEEMMEDFGHTKTVGEKEQPVKDLKSPNNSDSTPPQPPHLSVTITPASLTSVTSSRSRTPSMKETGLGTLEENQALTQDSPTSKTPTRDRRPSGQSSKGLKNQSDTSTLIKDSRPLKCQEGHQ